MKISIVCVGKIKEPYLKDGISKYTKKLSTLCDIEFIEIPDEQAPDSLSAAEELNIIKKESEKIRKKILKGAFVIALDVKGKTLDTKGLAEKMSPFVKSPHSHITFIIGGSLGLDKTLIDTANLRISLSDMTLPHQLIRLVLLDILDKTFQYL